MGKTEDSTKLLVQMTKEDREMLRAYADRLGISSTGVIHKALKDEGVFDLDEPERKFGYRLCDDERGDIELPVEMSVCDEGIVGRMSVQTTSRVLDMIANLVGHGDPVWRTCPVGATKKLIVYGPGASAVIIYGDDVTSVVGVVREIAQYGLENPMAVLGHLLESCTHVDTTLLAMAEEASRLLWMDKPRVSLLELAYNLVRVSDSGSFDRHLLEHLAYDAMACVGGQTYTEMPYSGDSKKGLTVHEG